MLIMIQHGSISYGFWLKPLSVVSPLNAAPCNKLGNEYTNACCKDLTQLMIKNCLYVCVITKSFWPNLGAIMGMSFAYVDGKQ